MKFTPDAQEYLDRYFYAIKNELPASQRNDIVAELQSNLMDSIEEQYSAVAEIDKTIIKQILINNGSPRSVTENYHGPRYLIGPKLYPIYAQVLKIVLTVLGSVLLVSSLISTFINPLPANALFGTVLEILGSIWSSILTSAAVITLVFAVLERKQMREFDDVGTEKWKPDDLPEITQPRKIRNFEHILGIVGGIVWISILIYLLNTGNIYSWINGERMLTGTITGSFKALLPFFITLSGLELANHAVIIAQQTYSIFSRWFKILLEIINTILLGFVLRALPLFTFRWENYPSNLQGQMQTLEPMIQKTFAGFLVLIFCLSIVSIIKRIYTELTQNPEYKY